MLVKFASKDTTLLALLLPKHLPAALERVGSNAPSVQGHLSAMDCCVDRVDLGRCESEAGRINLVKVTEDLKQKLVWETLESGPTVELRKARKSSDNVWRDLEDPSILLRSSHASIGSCRGIIVAATAAWRACIVENR